MNETSTDNRKAVDCYNCERSGYCAEIIQKIDIVLRRLGIIDYSFKVFVCENLKIKGGVENGSSEKESINKLLDDLL